MTKDEALKMAIKALLYGTDHTAALKACKEALAQPAQEPVAYIQASEINYIKAMKEEGIKEWRTCLGINHEAGDVPLYTHPAPSWQGLSYDEIEVIDADCWVYPSDGSEFFNHYQLARAIEQALKQKNTP